MHIKFLKHGTGSAKGAADYLTQAQDSQGHDREVIQVLEGDPHQVAAVADALTFKHKYRSGVISWSPEDKPTPEQIKAVLGDYKKMAFAGLEPDQYAFSAVLHHEKDKGIHIHTLTARVDLVSGKSMNPAPPGWQKYFDTVRDMHNHANGWARPDDPDRARMVQPGFRAYVDAVKLKAGMQVESDPRQLVTEYLAHKIDTGEIENRQDVLTALHEAGLETPRAGKNYITVKDPETGEKFRMKGVLFNDNFQRGEFERQAQSQDGGRPGADRRPNQRAFERAKREFERLYQRRVEFNQDKFRVRNRPAEPGISQVKNSLDQGMDQAPGGRSGTLSGHLRRELGTDAIPVVERDQFHGRKSPGRVADQDRPGDVKRHENIGNRVKEAGWQVLYRDARGGHDRDRGHVRKKRSPENHKEIINGTDRVGTESNQYRNRIAETASRNYRKLAETSQQLDQASGKINRSLQRYSPGAVRDRTRELMTDELSRFKREINLAEFASTYGFALDKKKSGRQMRVMRTESGGKIGVFMGSGGDQMYHDFRNGKNGSVIDFCQYQTGKNLGHVRKELRSYLGSPRPTVQITPPRPKPTKETQAQELAQEKAKIRILKNVKYLANRGIDQRVLMDLRFLGAVVGDDRQNVCFPHHNEQGFSGLEKKNTDFTGFSKAGEKGLWFSKAPGDFEKIVICESGIDALSHAQLHPHNKAVYVSLAGQMSHAQDEQLAALVERNRGKAIIGAFDNDEAGKRYSSDLERICQKAGAKFEENLPQRKGQDWNDVLKKTPERVINQRWDDPEKAQKPLESQRQRRGMSAGM
ncbi:hypothetical protein DO021_22165 [Desulfobacter hydrogenophilus]|uniref:DUF3991 domain-containing protein n=1 Tax=Desulfobacter hydrogenophilus TaxID=2291 RepID=A0A328FA02_9BACT|nr:toprim domain-containing protein [Desulfobacter hydrogenophilus]NDY74572.1 relaxase/mobilization nuclease domain-containing protein [Desulfobacter hydrogenophilus]QBH15743.1 DUF3991 domain-containing protein [Desulfobacter hydrogenophilus]RAL99866.1 hypothetical protein DO021_22165 [Desulfobacter hydrogenophilus]